MYCWNVAILSSSQARHGSGVPPEDHVTGIDWVATIADAAALRRAGLFLVEGRLVLERLLSMVPNGADSVVAVLATAAAAHALDLEARCSGRLDVRTPREMAALTGFNFHRGVLALVERPPMRSVEELLGKCRRPSAEGRPVFVVLEHLVDSDNVGSCFRNARAFGAAGVLLDERCADPFYRKAVRTSMGAVLDMPWTVAPVGAIIDALQARGVTPVALTPQADATLLHVLTLRIGAQASLALVVGNEGTGLSLDTLARCTYRAAIPMAPGADSLNVATALAVGLYEALGSRL